MWFCNLVWMAQNESVETGWLASSEYATDDFISFLHMALDSKTRPYKSACVTNILKPKRAWEKVNQVVYTVYVAYLFSGNYYTPYSWATMKEAGHSIQTYLGRNNFMVPYEQQFHRNV